jgi:hypothetical protein
MRRDNSIQIMKSHITTVFCRVQDAAKSMSKQPSDAAHSQSASQATSASETAVSPSCQSHIPPPLVNLSRKQVAFDAEELPYGHDFH